MSKKAEKPPQNELVEAQSKVDSADYALSVKRAHFSHNVEGWCNFWSFYREIAEWIPDGGRWVEVGAYWGQSFGYAVVECLNRGKKIDMVAVDMFAWPSPEGWPMEQKFHYEMSPIAGHFRTVKGISWEVADQFEDESVDFVFIDADHVYQSVRNDVLAWLPKVKPGGIIAGHDYNPPHEVKRAVDEIFGSKVVPIPSDDFYPEHRPFYSWKVQI